MIDEMRDNGYIEVNRHVRARKLTAVIDIRVNYDWELALLLAKRLDDDKWAFIGREASLRTPPSRETQRHVIEGLEERLRIRRKIVSTSRMKLLDATRKS